MKTLKRKINFGFYFTALLITFAFFIFGIVVGNYVANKKAEQLDLSQKAISVFLSSFEQKEKMLSKEKINYCNLSWDAIWEEKVGIGKILTVLELRLGKTDRKVMRQKEVYNEVQFKTLNLVEEVNKKCNYNWDIIVFFYTNNENDPKGNVRESELQGYALDTAYNLDREKVKIFSFDVNVESNSTKTLIKEYNATSVPTLVINGKIYRGLMTRDEIEKTIRK